MIAIVVLVIVIIILAVYFVNIYNGLIIRFNRLKNFYSQIGIELQRRYDLIPNLVETAKAYLSHEKETLQSVILARNQAASFNQKMVENPTNPENLKQLLGAENVLSGALSRLFALVEQYPDLKANETISSLSEEITSTENRVAFSKQSYNETVMEYNTYRETFPNNLIADKYNFRQAILFNVSKADKEEPVKISI